MENTNRHDPSESEFHGVGPRIGDLVGTWNPLDEELSRVREQNSDLTKEIVEDLRFFREELLRRDR